MPGYFTNAQTELDSSADDDFNLDFSREVSKNADALLYYYIENPGCNGHCMFECLACRLRDDAMPHFGINDSLSDSEMQPPTERSGSAASVQPPTASPSIMKCGRDTPPVSSPTSPRKRVKQQPPTSPLRQSTRVSAAAAAAAHAQEKPTEASTLSVGLKEVAWRSHNQYGCMRCPETYKKADDMQNHLRSVHGVPLRKGRWVQK
ncbi:uncharacterized protein SCHCODRAFT_02628320 [Schizophyllum commune H4-8]|nr:uncharacterized protein SCHCODRAFT_02628320 [Schizophyllum commune H4-8]KAI5891182.1 hypothetical protein SCHCODRAFT_02628320 [Schizophyllum commune H4-8]